MRCSYIVSISCLSDSSMLYISVNYFCCRIVFMDIPKFVIHFPVDEQFGVIRDKAIMNILVQVLLDLHFYLFQGSM